MKNFKSLQASIDFSTRVLIILLASGGSEPPTNEYFQNFLNFSLNFRENLYKTFLKFSKKSQKFLENFQKIINFSLIFYNFLNFFEFAKTRNF